MKKLLRPLAVAVGLCVALPALADYPERPVELVVPFAAGGGTDIMARLFASALEKEIGGTILVINRTGAGGETGMAEVATATPDGYKLAILNTPNILTIPIERQARFTPESFDLLGTIAEDPGTLSVKADSPIKTVKDLVAAAKEKPGQITYGTAGVGSSGHIAMLLLEQAADIKASHVPFTGSSGVRTSLLQGDIQVATANLGEAQSFGAGQPWRILGVMADERSAQAPDLPTFAEEGFPIIAGSLRGVGGPKGIPADVLEKLRTAMAAVMKDRAFLEASAKAAVPIKYLDAEGFAEALKTSNQSMLKLWKAKPWKE
jgi:tripartite-type tricarboxylate transporter receptor subunit TctC